MHYALSQATQAAVINLGSSPLVMLFVTILIVGFVVFVLLWVMDNLAKNIIAEPFFRIVRSAIWIIGVAYCVIIALDVIFGIRLINLQ